MILKIVKFSMYINTNMRKSVKWIDPAEAKVYQDMGLHWMTNANSQCALERAEGVRKDMPFWDQSCDTKKNFEKLIQSDIPNYWRFHTKEFTYRFNSFGFRAPEFDTVDWKNSYVILGCSHVQGTGNPFEETIGQYIAKELGHPVINMGVGGASVGVIYNNLLKLIKDYGKPKGVFILWSYIMRKLSVSDYYVFQDRDSWINPFWGRKDIIPTDPELKGVRLDDDYFVKCAYDRSICIESTKLLLHDTPLSMITDPYCWMLDCNVKDEDPLIQVPVPEEYKEELRNGVKGGTWRKASDESKKWFLNQIKARDIDKYNHIKGPGTSHWGRLVNKCIAKELVKNI